ncbi:uncharacterized protein CTHT_0035170 [Thermochaetoides thermophila DSM 1495]|uniref:Extracellular membrane protein CFEM domain-containing protein n=1 Tax=Chaetomium thermophilum (strain DSM 1495 / CBS 144.50 / IMI 039719) TaxID=759272 RepID=G0S6Q0_CHATD|nr:hypothetical protein CTHT_0035170 [Thermochaetoides thermophila DSM 1495]EGS21652.1 hypothetical protein CTHT_0035170 [Thermochaetoides thermophila DSM 1495]
MTRPVRLGAIPVALATLVLVRMVVSQASNTIDFGFYPEGAQSCLYQAAGESHCEASTVPLTNSCLCRNGGDFIKRTARCLGRESPDDLESVYDIMRVACSDSNTPIGLTKAQFLQEAESAKSSTSLPTATETRTVTATGIVTATPNITATPTGNIPGSTTTTIGNNDEDDSGLSKTELAGIIAGGAVAAIAILGGLGFFFMRKRRKRYSEESHPMLPQGQHGGAGAGGGGGGGTATNSMVLQAHPYSSPLQPQMAAAADWQPRPWGTPSPDLRQSVVSNPGLSWESPGHLSYASSVQPYDSQYGAYGLSGLSITPPSAGLPMSTSIPPASVPAPAPSPSPAPVPVPVSISSPPPPISELEATERHPLGTTQAPAEMSGSEPRTQQWQGPSGFSWSKP